MKTADVNTRICSFTRYLQFLFINKVRTRPVMNLKILDLIKLIEKCCVVVVIEYVCGRNDDSSTKIVAVLCASVVSAHIICVPPPEPNWTGLWPTSSKRARDS